MTGYILGPTLAGLISIVPLAIVSLIVLMREPKEVQSENIE